MSTLTYNGVSLEICRLNRFEVRSVKTADGVDFLYNHVLIEVQAVWNPVATALDKQGGVGSRATESMAGKTTVAGLKHTLMQPRGVLVYRIGPTDADILLESPQFFTDPILPTRAACDQNNGPNPISCSILAAYGSKTAVVAFTIETWIRECPSGVPLIGHRWEMRHEIDEHMYSTRTITGVATFDTAYMAQKNVKPDDFRQWLFHPVPDNMQRGPIAVTPSSDGTSVSYQFSDVEQTVNLNPNFHYTKIEGSSWQGADVTSFTPTVTVGINIRVWGWRHCPRNSIVDALFHGLAALGFGSKIRPGLKGKMEIDIIGRYGEVTVEMMAGVSVEGFIGGLFNAGLIPGFSNNWEEGLGELATFGNGPGVAGLDGATRGSHLSRIVAQALTPACTMPTKPAAYGPGSAGSAGARP